MVHRDRTKGGVKDTTLLMFTRSYHGAVLLSGSILVTQVLLSDGGAAQLEGMIFVAELANSSPSWICWTNPMCSSERFGFAAEYSLSSVLDALSLPVRVSPELLLPTIRSVHIHDFHLGAGSGALTRD